MFSVLSHFRTGVNCEDTKSYWAISHHSVHERIKRKTSCHKFLSHCLFHSYFHYYSIFRLLSYFQILIIFPSSIYTAPRALVKCGGEVTSHEEKIISNAAAEIASLYDLTGLFSRPGVTTSQLGQGPRRSCGDGIFTRSFYDATTYFIEEFMLKVKVHISRVNYANLFNKTFISASFSNR